MNIPEEIVEKVASAVLSRMRPCPPGKYRNTDHCKFCRDASIEYAHAAINGYMEATKEQT